MKIFFVFLAIFLASANTQKFLAVDFERNIKEEEFSISQDQNIIKFHKQTNAVGFVFQNGQQEDIIKNAVFISNIPHERFSVVRCGSLNKAQQRPDLIFSDKFEEYFKKRNFTLTLNENGDECFGFNVLYQKNYTQLINISQVQKELNAFISSSFSEVENNLFLLSFDQIFEIEVNYNQKNQTRYVKISSKTQRSVLEIHSKIPVQLGSTLEIFKGQVKQISQFVSDRSFYNAFFNREAEGTGLHQKSQIQFKYESSKQNLKKEGKECELAIVDYLDTTQYVDFDELYLHDNLNLTNYRVHDIERPSSLSPQHVYILKYRFKDSDITYDVSKNKYIMQMDESFLFHYRYRTPFEGKYKQSYMNIYPYFLLNCIEQPKKSNASIKTSLIERMVNTAFNTTNFRQIDVQQADQKVKILERQVPVGNIADKEYTLYITIFLTVSVCIFFAYIILRVSSKYNL
ncbi:PIG-X/PBN1 family protein (macronuclear) [Tetrahymena thermophila SB210]|uniref:PIG-X/PBN1 family protein n=1 Tax=Tetrahymena thermophila (strain SB210) TaxID=312017 RepID=I7MLA2_TETTS|nr:PIG-X/PBN1 family protein [Tetrahymena thermophila SB210]EAS01459.2 PIG-X/PBN1 family protein [Tetrahymena thermophila SB210]|eukprot:XP_001021705.2 PIG-X/PBN1 family protein [Tetrahymena thermophila SB210]